MGALTAHLPQIAGFPFDAARRRMTTVHRSDEGGPAAREGGPETVLERCTAILTTSGSVEPLDGTGSGALRALADELAARGCGR
jgi:magnesium-transporting ATPase (P-type)